MYVLNKGDYQDIDMLENLYQEIFDVYNGLYQLELDNNKSSDEYIGKIQRLNVLRKMEDDIYNRLFFSIDSAKAIVEYYKDLYKDPFFALSGIQIQPFGDKKTLIKYRLLNNANLRYYEMSKVAIQKVLEKTADEVMIQKLQKELYTRTLGIYMALDFCKITLAILDREQINKNGIVEEMVWIKYSQAFLIKEIEEELTKNNFHVNKDPYLTYPLVNNMFPNMVALIDANAIEMINFGPTLNQLLSINDFMLMDTKNMAVAVFLAADIRANLIMFNKEETNLLIKEIKEIIEEIKDVPNRRIVTKILEDILVSNIKDREILQTISLKLER